MSEEDAIAFVEAVATKFGSPIIRSPVIGTPLDVGLKYEDITFQAQDGIVLEGWFMPRLGSHKIIILTHPRWCNRSGCPTNREPWKALGEWGGSRNAMEMNFIPDFKVLHDAGYNVLAYDSRNMGRSSAAHGGISFNGRFESRDVIGSLNWVRSRPDLKAMSIGLFGRCNGAAATFFAINAQPEHFENVKCLVAAQPLSVRATLTRILELRGIKEYVPLLDEKMKLATGFGLDDMSPVPWAKGVKVPTFIYQVRRDKMTYESDVQEIFDAVETDEKRLYWIEDTTARFDGYREFQNRPEPMLDWFAQYM